MVLFDRPGFLFLLPVVLGALILARRGALTSWGRPQALTCLVVRGAIAVLVCLALAGPRLVGETREPAVVFLRDVSASAERETARFEAFVQEAGGRDRRSAEVTFAGTPQVVRAFGEAAASLPENLPRDASNLQAALEFAGAMLPADLAGRIVLLSDGVGTSGRDPLETAASLAARGVEIDVVPASPETRPEVGIARLEVPAGVRVQELFDLTAIVHASSPAPGARVRLYQDHLLVAELQRDLAAGDNTVVFPNVRAGEGLALYEVEVAAEADTRPENNRKKAAAAHGGAPKVLVVDAQREQSEPLAAALRAAGFLAETRPPKAFPSAMADLQAFDLVMFCDAPAMDFSEGQMKLLEDWVKNFGGGFLMIGGEESFGAGGYFRTPIATLLPVRIEREEREETPVVALLVILDRSGSMSAPAGGQTKMALANEGAALALEVLQGKDLFGVFAVDTRVQDVVPLGRVSDREGAARSIAGITAGGGGIYIYTSLAEALPRLRDAEARIKHIILFSDAADAEEKNAGQLGEGTSQETSALELAAAMLANRITLSVVALGSDQDKDTAFLRQLAAQGGGRFYLTADATTLPRLFTLETMRATESSLREDAFLAVPKGNPEALRGLDWSTAPLLLGFNVSRLKPGADLLLSTEKGDPLLATWRYGLGRVGAFTSDAKARWASEWLGWSGYGKFWPQVARALIQSAERDDLAASVREEDGRLIVEAEAVTAAGEFRDGLALEVSAAAGGAELPATRMTQAAPGRYRASLPRPAGDPVSLAVHDGGARPLSLIWTADYPAEFQAAPPGGPALEKLAATTGGQVNPDPGDVFRPAARPVHTRRDLAPWCLLAAALLWPLDVWARRRQWQMKGENSLPPFSHAR
jgi:Ca-activated chloride channel family protein